MDISDLALPILRHVFVYLSSLRKIRGYSNVDLSGFDAAPIAHLWGIYMDFRPSIRSLFLFGQLTGLLCLIRH